MYNVSQQTVQVFEVLIFFNNISEDADHCQQCGGSYKTEDEQDWVGCDSRWRWYHTTVALAWMRSLQRKMSGYVLSVTNFGFKSICITCIHCNTA